MRGKAALALCVFLSCHRILSGAQGYPIIRSLRSGDIIFSQYQTSVEEGSKARVAGKTPQPEYFSYTAGEDDSVFTVASRCSVPYDTIATLNGISESTESLAGKTLILPTLKGLYIPLRPDTALEILLAKENSGRIAEGEYPAHIINGREFYFLPGEMLSGTLRAFFLTPRMVLPLEKSVLTSDFGMRVSPISGRWLMHHGLDMAAPLGSPVFSCRNGTVAEILRMDATYGNCVRILHGNGATSIYAHLDEILVKDGDMVSAGQKIGTVGLTGLTTGPHLHFEIRNPGGQAQNPRGLLDISK